MAAQLSENVSGIGCSGGSLCGSKRKAGGACRCALCGLSSNTGSTVHPTWLSVMLHLERRYIHPSNGLTDHKTNTQFWAWRQVTW